MWQVREREDADLGEFKPLRSFDIPDLPKIMSSLALDTKVPAQDCSSPLSTTTDSETERTISPIPSGDSDSLASTIPLALAATATGSGRTRLSRSSKSDCLLRMNRRVSMKPQRKVASTKAFPETEADITKFYLNNQLGNAASRHNALETIFEEPSVVRNELRMIGLKKLKRTIAFKDGVNIHKTTVQSRRKKIKLLFGTSTKKFNKLSMDAFLLHLQGMREGEQEQEQNQGQGPDVPFPLGSIVVNNAGSRAAKDIESTSARS